MKTPHLSLAFPRPTTFGLLSTLLLASACGGSSPTNDSIGTPGEVVADDDGQPILVDPNEGGQATSLALEEIRWGRLVDVYDESNTPVYRDLLVGEDTIDEPAVELSSDLVTGGSRLQILYPADSAEFAAVVRRAEDATGLVDPKSDAPATLPPFSMVPRNAALTLRFSDLLDRETLEQQSVAVRVGDPAETAFTARVFADTNHGGVIASGGGRQFHPTRLIVDLQVSEDEAAVAGISNPNGIGLPASVREQRPSVTLRIATRPDPLRGLFTVLANLRGATVEESGPVDKASVSRDLIRAFRAGSDLPEIADPYGGFLRDETAPQLIGRQPVTLLEAVATESARSLVTYRYATGGCAIAAGAGDRLQFGEALAVVRSPGTLSGDQVVDVVVELLAGPELATLRGTLGTHSTSFRPEEGHLPACFVTITPEPAGFPLTGIRPGMTLLAEFSEPMNATSLDGLEGLFLTRVADSPTPTEIVVGEVAPSIDRCRFTYQPRLKLDHVTGQAEVYFAHLGSPEKPVTDLAGNELRAAWQGLPLTLNPDAPTDRTGGYVFRFDELDEDGDGFDEVRGQMIHTDSALIPRAVRRMSLPVSRANPLIEQMQSLPQGTFPSPHDGGTRAPFSPNGSRLMTAWRYADLGLGLSDESTYNIDVEAIHWEVDGGSVSTDVIESFSMELSHARRLPDEAADLPTASVFAPASGLLAGSFEDNPLSEPKLVHPASEGYIISSANSSASPNGRITVPYPMNQGADPSRYRYYTWRDTAIQEVGGEAGLGVPIGGLVNAGLLPATDVGTVAPGGYVPSIGLPLLMDFKTKAGAFSGSNRLETRLGGFPLVFGFDLPTNHRVFSEGGTNLLGNVINLDPDLAFVPSGGFSDVAPFAPLGTPTSGADSLVYLGQLDVVTRISRVHTVWLDAGSIGVDHVTPVLVPANDEQPLGTQLALAFRGADFVTGPPLVDASALDPYGDLPALPTDPYAPVPDFTTYGNPADKNEGVLFTGADASWKASIHVLDGSPFVQARITFVADAPSHARPTLNAIGFAYDLPE